LYCIDIIVTVKLKKARQNILARLLHFSG